MELAKRLGFARFNCAMASCMFFCFIASDGPVCHGESISVGETVIQVKPEWYPRSRQPHVQHPEPALVYFYSVKQRFGDWLYLEDEGRTSSGCARSDEVVPTKGACAFFMMKLREDPHSHFYYCTISMVKRRESKYDEALDILEGGIQAGLNSPALYLQKALVWRETGQFGKALVEIERALELDPLDPVTHYNRGWINHDKHQE